MNTPYKCPVCEGRGIVSANFYTLAGAGYTTTAPLNDTSCRSCRGSGIIWSHIEGRGEILNYGGTPTNVPYIPTKSVMGADSVRVPYVMPPKKIDFQEFKPTVKNNLSEEDEKDIVRLYGQNMIIVAIAREKHVSTSTIRDVLVKNNIQIRPRGRTKTTTQDTSAVEEEEVSSPEEEVPAAPQRVFKDHNAPDGDISEPFDYYLLTDEMKAEILEKFNEGLPPSTNTPTLAKEYKVSIKSIWHVIKNRPQ